MRFPAADSKRMKSRRVAVTLVAAVAVVAPLTAACTPVPAASACTYLPANNVWHADVSKLPVNAHSAAWMAASGGTTSLRIHPDFGGPYGIPFNTVSGSHPKVAVIFDYSDESDHVAYPLGGDTRIEGSSTPGVAAGGDAHALVVDSSTCKLYETWDTASSRSGWTAGSGAVYDLRSNALRPDGWTSADAAGLPILPGLLRYDEVESGKVDHAIRFTVSRTAAAHIWPARHDAGSGSANVLPPMGARFRLKANYSTAGLRPDTVAVLNAMKKYGMIVADNGSNFYFQGATDSRWPDALLNQLKAVPASAFEAIDESSLQSSANSGQVK
jgi:hypothetical protein